ncbi:unnamed protein product, partial [Effrenium voratum]
MAPLSQLPRSRTDDFKPSESRRGTAPAHVSRDWVAPLRPVSRPPSSTQPKPGSRPSSSRVMPNLLPGSRPSSSRPMPPFPQGSLAPSEHSPRVSGEFSWLPPLGKREPEVSAVGSRLCRVAVLPHPCEASPDPTGLEGASGPGSLPSLRPMKRPASAGTAGAAGAAPLLGAGRLLRRQVAAGRLPGFMSYVLQEGRLIHFEACGFADLAARVPLRESTLFRLYSQTKPFLVAGFLVLRERSLVSLEDPVAKFLPEFQSAVVGPGRRPLKRAILVHDLLAHTSGLGFGPGFGYAPENAYESTYLDLVRRVDGGELRSLGEWCAALAKLPLRFQPGKDWGYGYSSDVLGRLMEVVAGMPLDQFLRKEVLEPLGLTETFFQVPPSRAKDLGALYKREPWHGQSSAVHFVTCDAGGSGRLASPSQRVRAEPKVDTSTVLATERSVFLEGEQITSEVIQGGGCVCSVAGGLVSSLRDCGRFFQMLANEGELDGVRLLSTESVQLLQRDWLNDFTFEKRRRPLWVWNCPGIGFSPLGQLGVACPGARRSVGSQLRTVHWGGAGGSGYMINWPNRLVVLSYTGCVFDTGTQKVLWRAAFGGRRDLRETHTARWGSAERSQGLGGWPREKDAVGQESDRSALSMARPSLDDAKCSEKSWPCSEVPSAKKSVSAGSSIGKPASLAVKKGRNHAVYQRWQVVSSSNRFQSEEVLERDRQRQRAAACDLRSRGGGRHNASPARSHAAALFFGNGAQQEPAHLPPGALQHVARPPSRSMHIMPNNAAGPVTDILGAATEGEGTSQQDSDEGSSATSSEGEADAGSVTSEERSKDGNRRRSSRESEIWKPAMPRKHIPHALGIKRKVEDLPDINTLYEPRELAQLFKCMDAYVHLVLPPGHTHAHTPDMFLAAMLASLNAPSPGRPMTPSNDVGGAGAGYLRDKEGPLVLRPIFCRFLLASKLCGSRDSPHRYQDCVAAFDAHASRYEAFFGMPRNLLLRVLSGIVLPPGCEASLMASAFDVKRQLPQQVRRFLDHHLRAATGHCEARQKALDDSIARLPWVESLVWVDPATLPKVDEEGEEKEEKEKDKEASPPRRRGRLERQDSTRFGQDELGKAPEATLRLPPGLWPPLPPRYVISERGLQQWKDGIRQWEEEVNQQSASTLRALYENTARVVLGELLSSQLLEPEVLHFTSRFLPLFTRIFDEYADEHSADLYPEAGSNSDTGDEGESRGESSRGFNLRSPKGHGPMLMPGEEKTLKPREGPPDLMSFNAFFSFCAEFELFPGHASFDELKQIYDSAETAQELTLDAPEVPRRRTTASASAALASQLPQVDIEFLNKPLWEMSDMELLITFFFAALEQWRGPGEM